MISRRARNVQASPIRKLFPYSDRAKKRGIKVYHLNIGQPDIETPHYFWDAIHSYSENVLAYGPSGGTADLRFAIADYLVAAGIEVSADEIWITTGGSEAILFTLAAICDYDDEILIPEPFYTNYNGFASMAGVRVIPLATRVETGFRPPGAGDVKNKITSKTRGLVVCSPNNPTGTVYTREELEALADVVLEHDIYLIADEVYREFVFDGKKHTSVFQIEKLGEQAIIVDSISKRFSACGARVGFVVSRNRELMESILKFGQARLCPPTLEQVGAAECFRNMKHFIKEMIAEYQRRRDVVYERLLALDGAVYQKPEGAFYVVAKLPVDSSEEFAKWMLSDFDVDGKTTMVAPAEGFYATPGKGVDEVRIAYVLNEEDLKVAMDILLEGVQEYNKKNQDK
ncbi:pyridoxal phosphate-dependent aminotransferase [candidate division TA06 bacterium]|uniref:Aminotransferase n=1 Tax=candidate division TA06 bacterium TaxID=2250710 RepID=A0A523UNS8_UNCT6|nr:MAG: pyridoxal phosphate-dependent aminotransferase [candidate division TA06 bacterium]